MVGPACSKALYVISIVPLSAPDVGTWTVTELGIAWPAEKLRLDVVGTPGASAGRIDKNPAAVGLTTVNTGAPLATRVLMNVASPVEDAVVEVFYYSADGRTLMCQQSTALSGHYLRLPPGRTGIEFTFDAIGLQHGVYAVGATIRQRHGAETVDWFYGGTVVYVQPGRTVRGYFYAPHAWRVLPDGGDAS